MYISELHLQNFRLYKGDHSFTFSQGINYLVGNNNTGKTTIFKAVDFLMNGKDKAAWINNECGKEDVSVELVFSNVEPTALDLKTELKKLIPYVSSNGTLKIKRDSLVESLSNRAGKTQEIGLEHIKIFNPETLGYESPAGVDKSVAALFDYTTIYSDINNDEYHDFSKTKDSGKLITKIIAGFTSNPLWIAFSDAHKTAFGPSGISGELDSVASEVAKLMTDQYGPSKVKFVFSLPEIDSFIKQGQVLAVDDNGIETDITEKGTGMQRALALALIQVLAGAGHSSEDLPSFYFLDEPETFLHPVAQDNLLQAIDKMARDNQFFITTHSPYLLRNFRQGEHRLIVFSVKDGIPMTFDDVHLDLFSYSPTWAEINYRAFGIVSKEFHIELFGALHEAANNSTGGSVKGIKAFDDWLVKNGAAPTDSNHENRPPKSSRADQTMTVYIRNWIDHPGPDPDPSVTRDEPTLQEIKDSIDFMLPLLLAERTKMAP